MTDQRTIERQTTALLSEVAPTHAPDRLYADVLTSIGRTRQRTRWLAYFKESPMRTPSGVAVGSPTFRLASIMALTLGLILALGAAVAVGASLLPSPAPSGPPFTIVVDRAGTGDALTVAEGVAMAHAGDTVVVKPGTYAESVVITADITLQGDGDRGAVVLEFAADAPTYSLSGEPFAVGILLQDSGAHVQNLTVRGKAAAGIEEPMSAVVIDGGAPVIDGIDIVLDGDRWEYGTGPYYRRSAFQILGGSEALIRDSTWDGYTRMDGGANAPTFEGNVVTGQHIAVAGGGQQPVIRGNTFLDGAAIRWDSSGSGGIAEDNDITGWIGVDERNDPTILGNRIRQGDIPDPSSGYRGAAIKIASGATPMVERNEVTDSPYGIEVSGYGAKPEIRGNTIRGSTSSAIVIENGAAPTVDGNVIEGNATGVEVGDTTTAPVLTGNTFCGNETDLTVPDGSTLTLDGNTICQAGATKAP